mmetsp:Transcript_11804/g.41343  ORF Transcript_11804/g.41343 Transcript_11804/m.41343 type:complete len:388 (+) Transcript_11804:46-1209(+)
MDEDATTRCNSPKSTRSSAEQKWRLDRGRRVRGLAVVRRATRLAALGSRLLGLVLVLLLAPQQAARRHQHEQRDDARDERDDAERLERLGEVREEGGLERLLAVARVGRVLDHVVQQRAGPLARVERVVRRAARRERGVGEAVHLLAELVVEVDAVHRVAAELAGEAQLDGAGRDRQRKQDEREHRVQAQQELGPLLLVVLGRAAAEQAEEQHATARHGRDHRALLENRGSDLLGIAADRRGQVVHEVLVVRQHGRRDGDHDDADHHHDRVDQVHRALRLGRHCCGMGGQAIASLAPGEEGGRGAAPCNNARRSRTRRSRCMRCLTRLSGQGARMGRGNRPTARAEGRPQPPVGRRRGGAARSGRGDGAADGEGRQGCLRRERGRCR